MTKLNWIACNGIKPDLPDEVLFHIIVLEDQDEAIYRTYWKTTALDWSNVICYALEPVDPVQELVEAAKSLTHTVIADITDDHWDKLTAAIKAVEETAK